MLLEKVPIVIVVDLRNGIEIGFETGSKCAVLNGSANQRCRGHYNVELCGSVLDIGNVNGLILGG